MDLVDVPASTQQLDEHEHLDVPHRLIGARRPLEAGQVVVLHDLEGQHWWAAVQGLRFTETETIYELQLGHPMSVERAIEVGAYQDRPRTRPFLRNSDIVRMLDGLRDQQQRTQHDALRRRAHLRPA